MTSPAHAFHPRNALTYLGLLLGCGAIAAALQGAPAAAGALISLAVITDTFDGRYSRLFFARAMDPALGVQLDSLSDACTFGLAPVVCTAILTIQTQGTSLFVWIAGFLYLTSVLTRLAFYNVTHDMIRGFIGLPAPVGALIWSSTLCFTSRPAVLSLVLLVTAVGMISLVRLPRPAGPGLGLFALWPVLVTAGHLMGGFR